MPQKVLHIGSSVGITISKELLKTLGLRVGDQVQITPDTKRGGLLVLPLRRSKDQQEVLSWTDAMIDKYGPALRALAKK
jgi:putative addiction module antidote